MAAPTPALSPGSQSSDEDDLCSRKQLRSGLRYLGMRSDWNRSVLHLWARQLPAGMLGGHRSAMVAPDHLLFHGITKRLVTGVFRLLAVSQRKRVGVSLREPLARSHFPATCIYNAKRDTVAAVGISEWAATLSVLSCVLRRTRRSATRLPGTSSVKKPLHTAVGIVKSFYDVVCAAYVFPRLDLDGEAACRARFTPLDLKVMAGKCFTLAQAACVRSDPAVRAFGMLLDTPNLQRLRELADHVIPALLHGRHAQELLFENANQPLKRAVLSGNGRNDTTRAMRRYANEELAARIRLDFEYFHIPGGWLAHRGVAACLSRAQPLWSLPTAAWRCTTGAIAEESLHRIVVHVGRAHAYSASPIRWRKRASRGSVERLQAHDAVCVRVSGQPIISSVPVAQGTTGVAIRFFQVIAFFLSGTGTPSAVVHPFSVAAGGNYFVADDKLLYLALSSGVRRALALHECQCSCKVTATAVHHTFSNMWCLFTRNTGYPACSG